MSDLNVILMTLGDIREDIGGLRADSKTRDRQLDDIKKLLEQHVGDDAKVAARVAKLERTHTHIRGAVAGVSVVATMVVSGAAWAISRFLLT